MSSTHKLRACLPHGDPDIGAEIDVEITFNYMPGAPAQGPTYASGGQPADPSEVEFVSAVQLVGGKPVITDNQQGLDDLVISWLETDAGMDIAERVAFDDYNAAREQAAEMRRER
jgi:hypothetical protein